MEKYSTTIDGFKIRIPQELVTKYDRAGPRYTSYPTAPVWTNKFGPNDYANALRLIIPPPPPLQRGEYCFSPPLKKGGQGGFKPLSLYFHIPFCDQRCLFCGCSTIATPQHEAADRYVDALNSEIKLVCQHLDTSRKVVQLHLGGGTPTYLSCRQLEKLWSAITAEFSFTDDAEISIEIDPRVTTEEQIKLLSRLGFNRISLGVQDFSPKVQEAIGRVEPMEHVQKIVGLARNAGFKSVNIDLVYGLPYQTAQTFKDTVDKIIELSPDRIACFNFAYLPKMLPHQRKLPQDKLPSATEKFNIFCQTIEQFCLAGYDFIGMDHFAKSTDELSLAANNKTLRRNFQGYTTKAGTDLIGFGLTSISDVAGCYAQNAKKLADYYRAIESGQLATVRGWKLSENDIARRKIIRELFCNGCADVTIALSHHRTIALEKDGLIHLTGNQLQVTPLGRLFIRNIAMAFDEYLVGDDKFSRTV